MAITMSLLRSSLWRYVSPASSPHVQEAHNHQHPSLTPDQQVSDAVEADKSRAADVFRRMLGAREVA
jgi:hypothetical protein